MHIFPAIDIIKGNAVRLTEGDYAQEKIYGKEPLDVAKQYKADGGEFLHLVDLEGAKDGTLSNYETIRDIISNTKMFTEVGGGIRSMERIEKYLSAGVSRVILGTAAVNDPDFAKTAVNEFGEDKVAVGVDVKDGMVATDGWKIKSGITDDDFIKLISDKGVRYIIYTDISKDGKMQGTNIPAYERLSKHKGLYITASGGVTTLDEIEKLNSLDIYGTILGKALFENKISLRDAIDITKRGTKC